MTGVKQVKEEAGRYGMWYRVRDRKLRHKDGNESRRPGTVGIRTIPILWMELEAGRHTGSPSGGPRRGAQLACEPLSLVQAVGREQGKGAGPGPTLGWAGGHVTVQAASPGPIGRLPLLAGPVPALDPIRPGSRGQNQLPAGPVRPQGDPRAVQVNGAASASVTPGRGQACRWVSGAAEALGRSGCGMGGWGTPIHAPSLPPSSFSHSHYVCSGRRETGSPQTQGQGKERKWGGRFLLGPGDAPESGKVTSTVLGSHVWRGGCFLGGLAGRLWEP